jgi:GLPGLI family protein
MKTILTTLFAIAITSIALAQSPDKALARVRYNFVHTQDTTQKDKPYTENMLLVIGKNASAYTSYDKVNEQLALQKQLQEQLKNQAGSGNMTIKLSKSDSKPTSQLDYFYFVKENKFFTKERVFNNYLIEEEAPKINWKIAKDTASFSGVHCQKATATFKGRNWIAWFAPELPFQSGPWKLNGLPGLIVEAYDEKKEVQFQFAGLDNVTTEDGKAAEDSDIKMAGPTGSPGVVKIMGMDTGNTFLGNEIKLPTDAVKTTRKELDKLKDAQAKDPQGFMNAQLAGSGVKIGNMTRTSGGTPIPKAVVNNPIELPEKK